MPPSGLGTPRTSLHEDHRCRGQLCPVVAKPETATWPCQVLAPVTTPGAGLGFLALGAQLPTFEGLIGA